MSRPTAYAASAQSKKWRPQTGTVIRTPSTENRSDSPRHSTSVAQMSQSPPRPNHTIREDEAGVNRRTHRSSPGNTATPPAGNSVQQTSDKLRQSPARRANAVHCASAKFVTTADVGPTNVRQLADRSRQSPRRVRTTRNHPADPGPARPHNLFPDPRPLTPDPCLLGHPRQPRSAKRLRSSAASSFSRRCRVTPIVRPVNRSRFHIASFTAPAMCRHDAATSGRSTARPGNSRPRPRAPRISAFVGEFRRAAM